MVDEYGWEWSSEESYDEYQRIIHDIVKKLGGSED